MRLREFATREDAAATVAQKAATSGAKQIAGKIASKALPGAGTALSAHEALRRWRSGDKSGAVISTLASLGYLVPGPVGWVLGGSLDAYDMLRERDLVSTPQAKNIMHQIRRQYPQARSDNEALLLAVMAMQDADRRDIGRLDRENDEEEADIDRLDQEIADIEQDIKPATREALNPSLSFEARYKKIKGVKK